MTAVRPTKVNCIERLRALGITFDAIVDVGVKEQTSELRLGFPDLKHYLFEPVEEFYPKILKNYAGSNFELIKVAASDSDGQADLMVRALTGTEISHSSLLGDKSQSDSRQVSTVRLDTFFKDTSYRELLLKIDVDGAELKILQGATGLLDKVSCVMIEASRTSFFQRSRFLFEAGFALFDIVDSCYYYDSFHQCDLVFVRARHFESPRINGWLNPGFEPSRWASLDESASVWKPAPTPVPRPLPTSPAQQLGGGVLGSVAIPTLAGEVSQLIANMHLWARHHFAPCSSPVPAADSPKLLIVFNNREAQPQEGRIRSAFDEAQLARYFSGLEIEYLDLSGESDAYIRDYTKEVGAQGYKAGPNNQFFGTLKLASKYGTHTFLMETDCAPIRRDWLGRLRRLVATSESFWVLGSAYRGAGTLAPQFRRHINGNAVYAAGDADFQAFVKNFWEPRLRNYVADRDKRIAYDCALEVAFCEPWDTDPEAWRQWKQVAHLFRYTTYIQNISAAVDLREPPKYLAAEVLHRDPETYIIHNKLLASRYAELLAMKVPFSADAVDL